MQHLWYGKVRKKSLNGHIIQAKVRFGRIVQLIRDAPQMVFHLTEFFEDKSCDLTIQVNFSALAVHEKQFRKESQRWRLELKEWLILVDPQASAIKKSVEIIVSYLTNILKIVFTQRYSKWSKHILSFLSFILFSFILPEKQIFV